MNRAVQRSRWLVSVTLGPYIAAMRHDSPTLPFVKMHGAGNDFVIIDSRGRADSALSARLARALGDRHRGVGFDQLAELHASDTADFALTFWNADGSVSDACGNATRCVAARVLAETGATQLAIETARGRLMAEVRDRAVWVNMGPPVLDWAAIPLSEPCDIDALPLPGTPSAIGMGNPHCITFVPNAEAIALEKRGPALEHDPLFPKATNVEFATLTAHDTVRLRVWERGTGVTLACGSGACATAVAACRRGLTGPRVSIDADGGRLEVDWRDEGVWLTGPTAHIFDAILSAEFLAGLS